MPYIVSKASQDNEYTGWKKGRNGLNQKEFSVVVKGGANVVDKKKLEVPNGVVTEVTKEELEFLKQNNAFQRHLDRGWVYIATSKESAQKKAETQDKDENGKVRKDGSAQLTAQDFEDAGQKPPLVGTEENK